MRVPAARAEEARAFLVDLCPQGFEEVERAGELELAAYLDRDGEERLRKRFGTLSLADVPAGWADAWRSFHRPVRVGPLWVGPPWAEPAERALAVIVDPGQAFGTGGHATTRLCLELLIAEAAGSVLDLGCGSGVLAIAAARLGHAPVVALDREPAAVEATAANAAANGVTVEVRPADALADPLPPADLALANLEHGLVGDVARRVPARRLIASGYLDSDEVAFAGWRHVARRAREGWAADLLVRDD